MNLCGVERTEKTPGSATTADGELAVRRGVDSGRSDSSERDSNPGGRARYEPLVNLLRPSQLLLAARSNRPRARARLVESFMPLITSVARAYRHVPGVDRAELVQEGVVGILRALERYDPQLGTPFWSYASWWVREAMQQLVSEVSRPVVLSDRALRKLARVRAARGTFAHTHGHEPSVGELANATGLPVQQLQELVAAERCPRALGGRVSDRDGARVGDLVADPYAEDAYDELATRLIAAEVPRLLQQLNDREREVIAARYGLDGRQRSLRELGQTMGVSAERVRQIEQAALETLRAACSDAPSKSEGDSTSGPNQASRSREGEPRPGGKTRSPRIGLRGRPYAVRPERRGHRRGTLSGPIENAPASAG
jgi:RNA polymerase primary sigma factor